MAFEPSIVPMPAKQAPTTQPIPDNLTFKDGIRLTRQRYLDLCNYLQAEIQQVEQDTAVFRKSIILWRDFVDPEDKRKQTPWPGASNVFVPFPRMVLDALKASAKQAVTKQKELWTATATSPTDMGFAEDDPDLKNRIFQVQRAFVNLCEKLSNEPGYLDFKRLLDNQLDEMLTTGIGIWKAVREPVTRTVVARSPIDGKIGKRQLTLRRGPHFVIAPTGTVYWPSGLWDSVQEMPWMANYVVLTAPALQERRRSRGYLFVDDVIAAGPDPVPSQPDDESRLKKTGQTPATLPGSRVFDFYIDWDLAGDGKELSSLVIKYAARANRVMQIEYGDGRKPFDYEVASVRSGTIPGRGIIEPIVQPCRAINTSVNQTFDAQTLANSPCLVYPEESTIAQILAEEGGFYPGMGMPYKETKDEVDVLQFPKPEASSFIVVNFFQTIIAQLTRIGAPRLGDVSEGKRVPATLGLSTQQIGAEMIDEMIDRLRDSSGRMMSYYLELLYLDDPTIFRKILGEADGGLVQKILETSIKEKSSLAELIRIRLSASSGTRSVELERQNAQSNAQMTMLWAEKAIQLVNLYAQTPEGPGRKILLAVLQSSEAQMRRLVDLSGQPDGDLIVPPISLEVAQIPPPPPPQPVPPGAGAPSGTPPGAGVPPPGAPPPGMMGGPAGG